MAGLGAFDYFKSVLLVSFLFGLGITLLAYSLPGDAKAYGESYETGLSEAGLGYESIAGDVESSFNNQLDIPVVEIGSLVYYSGNILVDLLINFVTAIPQIITILINGVVTLFGNNLDVGLLGIVQGFMTAAIFAFYVLSVLSILTSVRSTGGVV